MRNKPTVPTRRYFGCVEAYDDSNFPLFCDFPNATQSTLLSLYLLHPAMCGVIVLVLYLILFIYCVVQRKQLSTQKGVRKELLLLAQVKTSIFGIAGIVAFYRAQS